MAGQQPSLSGGFSGTFTAGGLPALNPHSFRKTLARLVERVCRTREEWKKVDQSRFIGTHRARDLYAAAWQY